MTYRMLTGRDPFQGEDPAALLYQVVHEDPPPLATLVPASWDPAPLQAVLDRALAKRPEHRWGGMMEFARAFEAAAERTVGDGAATIASHNRWCSIRRRRFGCAVSRATLDAHAVAGCRSPSRATCRRRRRPDVPLRRLPTPAPAPSAPESSDAADAGPPRDWTPSAQHRPRPPALGCDPGPSSSALAGVAIATGWYHRLPGLFDTAREMVRARFGW